MRTLLLIAAPLLLSGCDVLQEVARGSAPEHAYAQEVPMDTAGVVARRVSGDFPGASEPDDASMLPDGRFSVIRDAATGNLVLYDLTNATSRKLMTGDDGSAYYARVSPDGRSVVYTWETSWQSNYRAQLRLLDLEGGEPRILVDAGLAPEGWIVAHAWAPDGQRLAAVRYRDDARELVVIPRSGGEPIVIRTLDWRGPGHITFSSDGRYLLYDHESNEVGSRDIYVVDLQNNREHRLLDSPADERLLGWAPGTDRILFSSDRTGTSGLWIVRVADGRAADEPVLVKPDFWRADPVGFTADGRFYYAVQTGSRAIVTAPLDARSGTLGRAEPVLSEVVDRAPPPTWSRDGASIAGISYDERARFILSIRSIKTNEKRDYALPPRAVRVDQMVWSVDGSTIFLRGLLGSQGYPIMRLELATGRITLHNHPLSAPGTQEPGAIFTGMGAGPANHTVLIRGRVNATGNEQQTATLYIHNLEDGSSKQLHQVRGGGLGFETLPGGRRVLVWGPATEEKPGNAYVIAFDGLSPPEAVAAPPEGAIVQVIRDATGRTLFHLQGNENDAASFTLLRSAEDGSIASSAALRLPHDDGASVVMSPSGDRLAYITGRRTHDLWVLEGIPGVGTNGP